MSETSGSLYSRLKSSCLKEAGSSLKGLIKITPYSLIKYILVRIHDAAWLNNLCHLENLITCILTFK